jgi:hypothetical protein
MRVHFETYCLIAKFDFSVALRALSCTCCNSSFKVLTFASSIRLCTTFLYLRRKHDSMRCLQHLTYPLDERID